MKLVVILFAILLIVIVGIQFSQKYFKENISFFSQKDSIAIKNKSFNLLYAKSDKEKEIGLSEKTSLPEDQAMLFIFDKPDFYPFWMRDMKFPIDIIFIKDNKIVTIFSSAQPPKATGDALPIYKPETPVNMVLEINAGLSDKYGFKKGDDVKINK